MGNWCDCWVKQCQCRGTSSGPRFTVPRISQQQNGSETLYTAIVTFSMRVCDVCEMPWKLEKRELPGPSDAVEEDTAAEAEGHTPS